MKRFLAIGLCMALLLVPMVVGAFVGKIEGIPMLSVPGMNVLPSEASVNPMVANQSITPAAKTASSVGSPSSWPTLPPTPTYYEMALVDGFSGTLPVYLTLSTKSEVTGGIEPGATIELIQWKSNNAWCKIYYNERKNSGWIQGKYIIQIKE